MTEDHAAAGADTTPGMPAAPSAPLPDGQAMSAGQEQPHVGPRTADSPASDAEAAPAVLPLQSPSKPQKEWRGDWQIAVVVAVLVLGGFLTLWLLQHSHRSIALPGMLLGLSKETSPSAQALANKIVSRTQAAAGDVMSYPAAAIYSGAGGQFTVVVGVPCPGGGCALPTAQQVVQGERSIGHTDAAAFRPGHAGGILTCFSYPFQNGQIFQCSWIDQVTAGQVVFDGAYSPSLADAAAKTRNLRDAIEQ